MKILSFLVVVTFMFTTSVYAAKVPQKFLKAIHMTETQRKHGPILGDGGRALGPLQIHKRYFNDAAEFDPSLGDDYRKVANLQFAERVVTAYLNRYASNAIVRNDYQMMARIHNGGPDGWKEKSTLKYWHRIKKYI